MKMTHQNAGNAFESLSDEWVSVKAPAPTVYAVNVGRWDRNMTGNGSRKWAQ